MKEIKVANSKNVNKRPPSDKISCKTQETRWRVIIKDTRKAHSITIYPPKSTKYRIWSFDFIKEKKMACEVNELNTVFSKMKSSISQSTVSIQQDQREGSV